MIAIHCAKTYIYNTADKKVKNVKNHHWRQHSMGSSIRSHKFAMGPKLPTPKDESETINDLRKQIVKYKNAHDKMKLLAGWNLRSTKSSLKDVQELLETLDELYGEDAFEPLN